MKPDSSEPRFCGFTPADLERLLADTPVEHVEFRASLGSTNDLALRMAETTLADFPTLVLAAEQTAGRGRGENGWWAELGALTFSLLLRPDPGILPPSRRSQLSLTTGLAVCEAIEEVAPGLAPKLKWPNDVFLNSRKVAGVLIEAPATARGTVVVGVGINVNNSVTDAPEDLRRKAIALCDATGSPLPLADVLGAAVSRICSRLQQLPTGGPELLSLWGERCLLTGRHVAVRQGDELIQGTCLGIDDGGALVIQTTTGDRACHSGVVDRFE